ncbi:MAG TPA: hypothetical protein VIK61_11400, partial [Acidimicrobiia bacterium]
RNRKRTFVVGGKPIVEGFAAVGDASVCTNPLYGRGCSLALVHAYGLADAVRSHPGDDRGALVAFDAFTTEELDPWYRAAVLQDEEAKAASAVGASSGHHAETRSDASSDTQTGPAATDDSREMLRAVMRDGLLPALQTSPVVFRAFLRWFNLLARPDALIADGEVVSDVMAAYAARESRPAPPAFGPTRDELLAILEAVA